MVTYSEIFTLTFQCFPVRLIGLVKYVAGSVKQKYECFTSCVNILSIFLDSALYSFVEIIIMVNDFGGSYQ
jgi:hypothetical protein